ncbi:MAG: hypothetical protein IJB67_07795 [Firmicutes bacterium]|nr:hypothetical protein [Bacillota bacterium]
MSEILQALQEQLISELQARVALLDIEVVAGEEFWRYALVRSEQFLLSAGGCDELPQYGGELPLDWQEALLQQAEAEILRLLAAKAVGELTAQAVTMGDVAVKYAESSLPPQRLLLYADELQRQTISFLAGMRGVKW